jgi:hypothetical protein
MGSKLNSCTRRCRLLPVAVDETNRNSYARAGRTTKNDI